MLYKDTQKERKEELIEKNSPPQQKPAAPTEEAPLLFKVSIIGFASSNPLSYGNNNWASDTIIVKTEICIAICRKLQY